MRVRRRSFWVGNALGVGYGVLASSSAAFRAGRGKKCTGDVVRCLQSCFSECMAPFLALEAGIIFVVNCPFLLIAVAGTEKAAFKNRLTARGESEQGSLASKSRAKEDAGCISLYFMAKPITK